MAALGSCVKPARWLPPRFCVTGFALGLALLANRLVANEEPALKITLRKGADTAAQKTAEGAAIVTIASPSGIGGAELKPLNKWPERIVLRLELKGLEGFRARAGNLELAGHLGGSEVEVSRYRPDGKAEPVSNAERAWKLPISRQAAFIEISLPAALYGEQTSLQVSWIDFYR